MAKRFTDTDKWKKNHFSELSLKMKLAWIYLCDNCDHAGIWDANFRLMSFHVGEKVIKEEFDKAFGRKIKWLSPSKLFIQSFVDFQYGALNPENRAHKSVINRLEKQGANKALVSPLQGAKDKDKDLDKDPEQEKEKDKDLDKVKDQDRPKNDPEANKRVFESYKNAYFERYKIEVKKERRINAQISTLVKEIGVNDAVDLVRFYLIHNDFQYVKNTHSFGLCLRDYETLRTQMIRGKVITTTGAKNFEKVSENASQADMFRRLSEQAGNS